MFFVAIDVLNADGRKFECKLEEAPTGFTVIADEIAQRCAAVHNSRLDYEIHKSVSIIVRVRVQGEEWTNSTGAGYHSKAMVCIDCYTIKL